MALAIVLAWMAGPVFSGWKRSKLRPGWLLLRPPHEVSAILIQGGVEGEREIVWAGGRDGLSLIDCRSGTLLPKPEGTGRFGRVRALLRDAMGNVLVAHGAGIAVCTDVACKEIPAPEGAWLALLQRRDRTLLAAGEAGLAQFKDGSFRLTDGVKKLDVKDPDVLYEDSMGAPLGGVVGPCCWRTTGRCAWI